MAASRFRQRGAVAATAAAMLGVAITLAALVIDIGHLYWVRRDLQRCADLASLSAVRDLAGAAATARSIAAANGFDAAAAGNTLSVVTGSYDANGFAAGGPLGRQNAVQVTVAANVPYFFVAGSRSVSATAVAVHEPIAGFSLGSFVARLDAGSSPLLNSLLGGLLGGAVNLDLLSYQALAAASLKLGDLQAVLNLATVDALLDTRLSLADWLDASIAALQQRGDAVSLSAASVLGTLRLSAVAPRDLTLGDLVKVGLGNPDAAASAQINLLQLVTLAAEVAGGGNLLKTTPSLSIPGIANVSLALALVQPPSIAIGPARQDENGDWVTRAHSGQVRLRLNLTLLGSVSGGLVNLPIYIESGAADASLTGIACRAPVDSSLVTIQTQPQLLTAYIGNVGDAAMQNRSAPVTVTAAPLLNLLLVRIDGYAQVPLQGPAQTLTFTGPFNAGNTQSAAGASLGLGGLLDSHLQLTPVLLGLPLPLGGILSGVTSLLGAVLGPVLDNLLLDPLLSLLGIRLGGGDVTAFMIDCAAPRLVQ